MSDVQFEDEQGQMQYASASSGRGGIIGLLMRMKIAQSEKQANAIIVLITIVAFILAIVIFAYNFLPVNIWVMQIEGKYPPATQNLHPFVPAASNINVQSSSTIPQQ